jgi:hypothetical protein
MREEIIEILRENWNHSYNDCADDLLVLGIVSKSVAKQYAEFCVRCDREGLPLLELDDYIKQYCC